MKESLNVLHITDLHISDVTSTSKEYLRKDFYEKYIEGLSTSVLSEVSKIDALIVTGDFIDRGNVQNFDHAKDILIHLASMLNLKLEQIGVCIGNHDIKSHYDKDDILDPTKDSRKDYKIFEEGISNNINRLAYNERFSLNKLQEHIYFLSLDSTLNRTKNQPGKFDYAESKEILNAIKEHGVNHPNNLLIVGSHYPLAARFNFKDEDGWYDKHIWRSAQFLRNMIQEVIDQSNILYLFGDIHKPDIEEVKNELLVMSGRIGTKVSNNDGEKESVISREATLIKYDATNHVSVQKFNYLQEDHDGDENTGYWKSLNPDEYEFTVIRAETIKMVDPSEEGEEVEYVEDKILNSIARNKLYKIGKFQYENNGERKISMGWVSINKLLSKDSILLLDIVNQSKEWIYNKISEHENISKNTLLVGIDFWGSIISSQLSIKTGCKNLCKANKGSDEHYSLFEIFNEKDAKTISQETENVILITDIVASGSTLNSVYSKICKYLSKQDVNFYAISVLSDRYQDKSDNLSFLTAFGTFCSNLRIPIVDSHEVPDDSIVAPFEYFK